MSENNTLLTNNNGETALTKRQCKMVSLLSWMPLILMILLVLKGVTIFNGSTGWFNQLLGLFGLEIFGDLNASLAEYFFLFVTLIVATVFSQVGIGLYLFGSKGFTQVFKRK